MYFIYIIYIAKDIYCKDIYIYIMYCIYIIYIAKDIYCKDKYIYIYIYIAKDLLVTYFFGLLWKTLMST